MAKEVYNLGEAIRRKEHLTKVLGQEYKKIWEDYKSKLNAAKKEGKVAVENSLNRAFRKKKKLFNEEWSWFHKKSMEYVFHHYERILDRWQNLKFKGDIRKVTKTISITATAALVVGLAWFVSQEIRMNQQSVLWLFIAAFIVGIIFTSLIRKKPEGEVLPAHD
jgi:hypothetical protein